MRILIRGRACVLPHPFLNPAGCLSYHAPQHDVQPAASRLLLLLVVVLLLPTRTRGEALETVHVDVSDVIHASHRRLVEGGTFVVAFVVVVGFVYTGQAPDPDPGVVDNPSQTQVVDVRCDPPAVLEFVQWL